MSFLLIVSGPPGAGKSTLARVLAGRFEPSVLVQGDAFFGFLERGAIEPWLPEAHGQNEVVTRAAAAAAGRYAAEGFATVYDGLIGPWFLPAFLETTGSIGWSSSSCCRASSDASSASRGGAGTGSPTRRRLDTCIASS